MSADDAGFKAALEEAKQGAKEGGVPIGACLVDKNGKILGRGYNMRMQKSSAILHVCSKDLDDIDYLHPTLFRILMIH